MPGINSIRCVETLGVNSPTNLSIRNTNTKMNLLLNERLL